MIANATSELEQIVWRALNRVLFRYLMQQPWFTALIHSPLFWIPTIGLIVYGLFVSSRKDKQNISKAKEDSRATPLPDGSTSRDFKSDLATTAPTLKYVQESELESTISSPSAASPPTEFRANTMGDRMKAAGQLATKQALRARLTSLNLPNAYRKLGKYLVGVQEFRNDLAELFGQFDELKGALSALIAGAAARPPADGFKRRLREAAVVAQEMAQRKAIELNMKQLLGKLGNAAFEMHHEESGPAEIVGLITHTKLQIATLDAEIARLSKSKPGELFTPPRIVFVGIMAGLLMIIGIWILCRSGTH